MGGRYGGLSKEDEERIKQNPTEYFGRIRSITNREYEQARSRDIATFIFIEQGVFAEYRTYKENKENKTIKYAHVDDARIYEMVDDIMKQKRGNFLKDFSTVEDITTWLRDQWAGIFVDLLRKRNASSQIKKLENQIIDLTDVVETLKKYSEELIRKVNKTNSSEIIDRETKRAMTARYRRFVGEPMLRYLENIYKLTIDGENSLKALLSSEDLSSFLKALSLSDEQIKEFLEEAVSHAKMEYTELKHRYGSDIDELDIEADEGSKSSARPARRSRARQDGR